MPESLADTFAALGNPTRFALVEQLLQVGELPVSALLAEGDISAPALSRHLKVLRQAGVLEQRIDRQQRLYSVRPEAIAGIDQWVLNFRGFWEGGLDRLGAALEKERH